MKRRELIILFGGVAAWPLGSHAQQTATPMIGFLGAGSPGPSATNLAAFHRGLSEAGYVEGQNVAIEYRWAEGHSDRLPALAVDLVARNVDVIVAAGAAALAVKNATSTIPIVFVIGTDPVMDGLVASLTRPGGNLTGISRVELMPKRLQLLSELAPQAKLIALLANSNITERAIGNVLEAARATGVQLHILKAGNESEIDTAFGSLVQMHAGALIVSPSVFFYSQREQILALALRHAVPVVYDSREYVDLGGLISYDFVAAGFGQVGIYAGGILKGEKPADLPVQQPTKFELVINLKTAKALGLTVPSILLAQADEVIE